MIIHRATLHLIVARFILFEEDGGNKY